MAFFLQSPPRHGRGSAAQLSAIKYVAKNPNVASVPNTHQMSPVRYVTTTTSPTALATSRSQDVADTSTFNCVHLSISPNIREPTSGIGSGIVTPCELADNSSLIAACDAGMEKSLSYWPPISNGGATKAAASVTSTAPTCSNDSDHGCFTSESRTPSDAAEVVLLGEQAPASALPWSLDQTYLLCSAEDGERFLGCGARLLDSGLASVATAVERLNQGVVFCPEDFCTVFSAKCQAYYLLYRRGCRERALAHIRQRQSSQGASPQGEDSMPQNTSIQSSTPRCWGMQVDERLAVSQLEECRPSVPREEWASCGSSCSSSAPVEQERAYELVIGDHCFHVTKIIGQGAFGVVWKAFDARGGTAPVAVKTMETATQDDLAMAIFEAELLRLLHTQLPAEYSDRVPQYIAHSCTPEQAGQGQGGTVNLAMSFIPGLVLDQWLYGISDEEHKHVEISQIVRGPLPGSRMHSMSLTEAGDFTAGLLTQLAGVFAALQPIAYHRDISPHNVLINDQHTPLRSPRAGTNDVLNYLGGNGAQSPGSEGQQEDPSFALIDFGLAVRSDTWQQDWNESNLAGDPRYWMPPAWMAFAFGFEHVESHHNRSLVRQYLGRLDHYGLGVLGLEMLFALWDIENRFNEQRAPGMLEAREAWCDFWEAMFGLFQMFHMQGPEVTREYLEQTSTSSSMRIAELLKQVQQKLRIAESDPGNADRAALLHVLADLTDEHGVLEWTDIPAMLAGAGSQEPAPPEPTQEQGDMSVRHDGGLPNMPCSGRSSLGAESYEPTKQHTLMTSTMPSASPSLPQVTRYEVSSNMQHVPCGVDRLSSTLQTLPSARSPTQERGVQLFSHHSSNHSPASSAQQPNSPTKAAIASPAASSPSSYVPPTVRQQFVLERPRSYVPPASAPVTAPARNKSVTRATYHTTTAGLQAGASSGCLRQQLCTSPGTVMSLSSSNKQQWSVHKTAATSSLSTALITTSTTRTSQVGRQASGLCATVRGVRRLS